MTTQDTARIASDLVNEYWALELAIRDILHRDADNTIVRKASANQIRQAIDALESTTAPPSVQLEHLVYAAVNTIRLAHDLAVNMATAGEPDDLHEETLELLVALRRSLRR